MGLTRDVDSDDSGSGTDGTIHNNAWLQSIYDTIEIEWSWDSVTHSDANFKGDGVDANWVVAVGDQQVFKYRRIGKKIEFQITLATTSVASTPGTLQITIPGSFSALPANGGAFWYSDNGTQGIGRWYVDAAGTTINLAKTSGTWTNSTNNTTVQVSGFFEQT